MIQTYTRNENGGAISAINDPFGASFLNSLLDCKIGAIIEDLHNLRDDAGAVRTTRSNFRVLRRVDGRNLRAILRKAKIRASLERGFWYEVIGD